jgi:gluconokinase
LKHAYRDRLWQVGDNIETTIILLEGDPDLLTTRIREREGHFMKAEMVKGEFANMEDPGLEEVDVVPFDVDVAKESLIEDVVAVVGEVMEL